MVYTVIIFATRKQGLSPAAFKRHYESTHVPLVRSITGPLFPRTHTRHYIHRSVTDSSAGKTPALCTNNEFPATVLIGGQTDFDYDAYAELVFDDEKAFQAFFGCVQRPETAEKIANDEKQFLDQAKMRVAVLGESKVTRGNGGGPGTGPGGPGGQRGSPPPGSGGPGSQRGSPPPGAKGPGVTSGGPGAGKGPVKKP